MPNVPVEDPTDTDDQRFTVVLNAEEQHSIWPVGRDIPAGWWEAGFTGPREACLAHIDEVWPDITPLSVRQRLAEAN